MSVADLFDDYQVPSLPRATLRALELAQDPYVDIHELGKAIELDPALSSRVVQLSNSSLFGLAREVTSVQKAIIVLGLRTVRLTALSLSILQVFPKNPEDPRLMECWRRVLTNAMGCRNAAGLFGLDPEDSFLAGLLQDIAMLVLADKLAAEYFELMDRSAHPNNDTPIHVMEREALGIDHAALGARLLEDWKLPSLLISAIGSHHEVDLQAALAEKKYELPVLMATVETITEFLLHPTGRNFDAFERVSNSFGESSAEIDKYLQQLEIEVHQLADLLDLTLPAGKSYEEIVREAREAAESLDIGADISRKPLDSQSGLSHRDVVSMKLRQELIVAHRHPATVGVVLLKVEPISRLEAEGRLDAAVRLVRDVADVLRRATGERDAQFRFAPDTFCLLIAETDQGRMQGLLHRLHPQLHGQSVSAGVETLTTHVTYGVVLVKPGDRPKDPREVLDSAVENLQHAGPRGIRATTL